MTLLQMLRDLGEVKLRLVAGGEKPTLEAWAGGRVSTLQAEDLRFATGGALTLVHGVLGSTEVAQTEAPVSC